MRTEESEPPYAGCHGEERLRIRDDVENLDLTLSVIVILRDEVLDEFAGFPDSHEAGMFADDAARFAP